MGPIGQIFSFHIINSLNGICHYHAFFFFASITPHFPDISPNSLATFLYFHPPPTTPVLVLLKISYIQSRLPP